MSWIKKAGEFALNQLPVVGPFLGQMMTNRSNMKQAKNMMDFQKYMSNTAHQREVADLKKSGLSMFLGASGSGSTTPQGAQANLQNPAQELVNHSSAMRMVKKQEKLIDADTEDKKSSAGMKNAQRLDHLSRASKNMSEEDFVDQQKDYLINKNAREQLVNDESVKILKQQLLKAINDVAHGKVQISKDKADLLKKGYDLIKDKRRSEILGIPILGHLIVGIQEVLGGNVTPLVPIPGLPKIKNKNPIGFGK